MPVLFQPVAARRGGSRGGGEAGQNGRKAENDLLHFRKQTPKQEKAYPKMGENSVKIFKIRETYSPPVTLPLKGTFNMIH